MSFQCPKCDAEFFDRLKYCPECGFDYTAGQKRCPKCREQVAIDSVLCPSCGLDFEKWAYFVPRVVVFGTLSLLVAAVLTITIGWNSFDWIHRKATVIEGVIRSDTEGNGIGIVPAFLQWQTGEEHIRESTRGEGKITGTDYMYNLIPLPPGVNYYFEIPAGEKVWIIRRHEGETSEWIKVGRYGTHNHKYGWVHSSSINYEE